jgi:hypothetical protein
MLRGRRSRAVSPPKRSARLSGGSVALALLVNALATAAALFALIEWLTPLSGAHFNPLVSLALALRGDIAGHAAAAYVPAQIAGAFAGVAIASLMFDAPVFSLSTHARSGVAQWLGEFVRFHLRTVGGGPDMFAAAPLVSSGRCGRLCRRRVLVHADRLCQSRGDAGAGADRYLLRHPAIGCPGFYRVRNSRRGCRDRAVSMAAAPRSRAGRPD